MLRIGRLTDYAIAIIAFLAKNPDTQYSAMDLAKKLHMGFPTVSKLLKILAHKKLLKAERGIKGGYHIEVLPEDITLAQLVSILEGSIGLTKCCGKKSSCPRKATCTLSRRWQELNSAVVDLFSHVTLKELMEGIHPLQIRQQQKNRWETIHTNR